MFNHSLFSFYFYGQFVSFDFVRGNRIGLGSNDPRGARFDWIQNDAGSCQRSFLDREEALGSGRG